jgi:transposase InsO family protein
VTVKRERLKHVIALGEQHLLNALLEYAGYYNESRTHQSLGDNTPTPRPIEHDR